MKTIYLVIVFGCALLVNTRARAQFYYSYIGRADVNITGAGQDLEYQQVTGKTNVIRGATNDISVLKSSTTNFVIDASSLLDLIANSLNTNFPAGTQLLLGGPAPGSYDFAVSDSTGTNVAIGMQALIAPLFRSVVNAGLQTQLYTNQFFSTGSDREIYISSINLQYDDSTLTTRDGTHTIFSWNGVAQARYSANLGTGSSAMNVTMNLTGGGQIRNQYRNIFTGTVRGKLTLGP